MSFLEKVSAHQKKDILGFVGYTDLLQLLNSVIVVKKQPETIHEGLSMAEFR